MTTTPTSVSLRDRILLRGLRALPTSLARHLLFLLQSQPTLADAWGYHIRAIHYYDPLPDFSTITAESTRARRQSPAIEFDLPGQLRLAQRLGAAYGAEIEALGRPDGGFSFQNEYFAGLDAAMYYALIRDLGPAKIVEIGSGFSTHIAAEALRRNRADGRAGALICVEPYPQPRLTTAMPAVTLIQKRVEEVDLAVFDALEANDILFLDSSHAVKFGGDVCRVFLEILPRLKPGVWVHVHDIFFPQDYPARWLVEQRLAFTEQYLLEAFLAFNQSFVPRCALHWLWMDHADDLRRAWGGDLQPASRGAEPASFWMMRRN